MHETLALLALLACLVLAVRRPAGAPETLLAVPVAGLLIAAGCLSVHDAWHQVALLGPVVGFLAAVLALADGCAGEGLFEAASQVLSGSPQRLLLVVVGLASVTTAVLSLDTTVVLLTPVVMAAVRRLDVPPRPHLYAVGHLSNSASLLLPVSNLTNLLAVAVVPLSFPRFAVLMVLPWLVVVAIETAALRRLFRTDLTGSISSDGGERRPVPRLAAVVVLVTVSGFALQPVSQVAPVWVAMAGAAVLCGWRVATRRSTAVRVARATAPSFCLFVLGLGVVVRAVSDDGLGRLVRDLVPAGHGFVVLLAVAGVAAVMSNVLNNLPATLLLLPVVATHGVAPVLAMLVGVNVGPNLTYPGSLATLLWRRVVRDVAGVPDLADFTRLGLMAVPACLVGGTAALWLSLRLVGP